MGKKPNPTVIGAFVLGAIALAVLGVLVFGSGQYFKKTNRWVLYFPGSIDGLAVGAPVKFRGVEFGRVTNIQLVFAPNDPANQVSIPVYVETDPSKSTFKGTTLRMGDAKTAEELVARGLRAQLQTQSLLTGLLFVQIDFFPDTPATYVLPQPSTPPEIPTIPTTLEEASDTLRQVLADLRTLRLEELVQDLSSAVRGIDQLANSPALRAAIDGLPETVKSLNDTLANANALAVKLDGHVTPLARQVEATLSQTQQTLGEVERAAGAATTIIEPGSPLDRDLHHALADLASAARAIQLLADYLERNPSALLYGKPTPEGKTP